MTVKEFHACTYREFLLMMDGYVLRRSHEFESTRAICYYTAAVNWDTKKAPLPTLQQFWPLPTDDNEGQAEQQKDDYEHLKNLMEEAKKNKL